MRRDERGATAVLVAASLVFLFGAAALAVDVSGFQNDARLDQTTSDLSCLAGVIEANDADRVTIAAAYTGQNWSAMSGQTPTDTDSDGVWEVTDGSSVVEFEPSYAGNSNQMRVTVREVSDTTFGQLFTGSVGVTQEAICQADISAGGGILPFGATPGWDGILQQPNPCPTGNCRALDLPRNDVSGSGPTFVENVEEGGQLNLIPYKQPLVDGGPYPAGIDVCTSSVQTCTIIDQNQGVSSGQLEEGMVGKKTGEGRLQDLSSDTAPPLTIGSGKKAVDYDDDSPDDILGTGDKSMPWDVSDVPDWDSDVHGPFNGATLGAATHLYWNKPIAKCNSPRLVKIPIIAQLGWSPGNAINLPSGNSDPVKVIGFYDAIITDPNDPSDFAGGNLKTTSAVILWTGPKATCTDQGGQPFASGNVLGSKEVKLTD